MINIKVLGPWPSCTMCGQLEAECQKAAKDFPDKVLVQHLDMMTAEFGQYKGMVPPILVVGNELISTGKVLPAAQIKETIIRLLKN